MVLMNAGTRRTLWHTKTPCSPSRRHSSTRQRSADVSARMVIVLPLTSQDPSVIVGGGSGSTSSPVGAGEPGAARDGEPGGVRARLGERLLFCGGGYGCSGWFIQGYGVNWGVSCGRGSIPKRGSMILDGEGRLQQWAFGVIERKRAQRPWSRYTAVFPTSGTCAPVD